MTVRLGIDIGGSGVKGAPVDLDTAQFTEERLRFETPQPATPEAVATTVTAVAGQLQAKGLIRYRRGVVDILDRAGLEAIACECYGAVRDIYDRLLPASFD